MDLEFTPHNIPPTPIADTIHEKLCHEIGRSPGDGISHGEWSNEFTIAQVQHTVDQALELLGITPSELREREDDAYLLLSAICSLKKI